MLARNARRAAARASARHVPVVRSSCGAAPTAHDSRLIAGSKRSLVDASGHCVLATNLLNYPSDLSMSTRSYHSGRNATAITPAIHLARGTHASSLAVELCSPSFHRTVTNMVLRAAFSTNPPSSNSSDDDDKQRGDRQPTKVALNDAADALLKNPSASLSGRAAPKAPPKKRKVPEAAVVHHATATDAFVSFVKSVPDKFQALVIVAARGIASMLAKTPGVFWYYLTHPFEFKEKLVELKELAKKEARHYWMGSKLLAADVRTARQMLGRSMQGSPLTRRERKQLLRTVTDVFRLVPMSIFVLIPFMEFALPFALKIFPNMLPSTFQDSLKAEENMKKELKMRLTMAEFFQETLQDLAHEQKKRAARKRKGVEDENEEAGEGKGDVDDLDKKEQTAASFLEFIEKARNGEMLPAEEIVKYASYFEDELTLDNMPRMQLVNFCRYMSIPPYGSDNVLRFQLRHKTRSLLEDDQRILWEGIDSLTKMELREACQERGMRSTGLSKDAYKRALQQWLDLSVNRNVPISLLIMSRTFFLQDEMTERTSTDDDGNKNVAGIADVISGLDRDVVNEVVLSVASSEEKSSNPDLVKIKLEVLEHQNELIEEEKKEREEAAAKKREQKEKARAAEDAAAKAEADAKEEGAAEASQSNAATAEVPKEDEKLDARAEADKVRAQVEAVQVKIDAENMELASDTEAAMATDEEEEEQSLSTEEIDAISQLVSPDPVSSEREKLEQIKAAMLEEEEDEISEAQDAAEEEGGDADHEGTSDPTEPVGVEAAPGESVTVEESDAKVAESIKAMDEAVDAEADAATKISFGVGAEEKAVAVSEVEDDAVQEKASGSGDEKLDKAVDRLKYRVDSMVAGLETQLTDVETKIGDKLHLLDKDMDEIISMEELAQVLQQVLKRNLSAEESMAMASDMDTDKDGYLSVAELASWLETNKLIKLVEEGRDEEIDRMIAKRKDQLRQNEEEWEEKKDR